MRFIPQQVVSKVSNDVLIKQYKDCVTALGKGYNKKNRRVNYAWKYTYEHLVAYSIIIQNEILERKLTLSDKDINALVLKDDMLVSTGKQCDTEKVEELVYYSTRSKQPIFLEHDGNYLFAYCINMDLRGIPLWHHFTSHFSRPTRMLNNYNTEIKKLLTSVEPVKQSTITSLVLKQYDKLLKENDMWNYDNWKYVTEEVKKKNETKKSLFRKQNS